MQYEQYRHINKMTRLDEIQIKLWLKKKFAFAFLLYNVTSEVKKCCLKYKSRGISRVFYISNNISTPRRLLYNKNANKNIILILKSVTSTRFKDVSVYNRFRATPLVIWSVVDDQLFISCVCLSEIKYTHVYIQVWQLFSMIKISIIGFLYPLK
jgi:hypothetical protein